MNSIGVVGMTMVALALSVLGTGKATAAISAASCSTPPEQLLKRIEIDLPGKVRVTRSVDIPANTEVLIEAFEAGVDSRLEMRQADGDVSTAESALHRWTPHRLIVPRGAARKADITVVGLDRAHGKVDLRISNLATRHDRRCVDFWHAMADGDSAFSRGRMIFRTEIDAPPGAAEKAYESALAKYARAAEILGPGGLDEAQTRLVRAAGLMTAVERYPEALEESSVAQARFEALGHEYGRDLARFHLA